jgi:DNA-binding transcriptional LysR family regulator
MRFKGLDLNLLLTLKTLLEERSVSTTAHKLNVTQPAVSTALKKLRDYFKDELLIVKGKQVLLSSHALEILPELTTLLENVDIFVSKSTRFNPESTTREFTLAANDYFCSVTLAPMLSKLVRVAPQVKVNIVALRSNINNDIRDGKVDLAFSPADTLAQDLYVETLYREGLAILTCKTNKHFRGKIKIKDIADAAQVLVDLTSSQQKSMLQKKLQELGIPIKVNINLPSFLVAPELILNTELITIVHKRLALKFSKNLPLLVSELPSEIASLSEFDYCMFSHPDRQDDPGLKWLKSMIKDQSKGI